MNLLNLEVKKSNTCSFLQVRGVGMCGYYRLPGEPTKEETDDKTKKESKEEKVILVGQ